MLYEARRREFGFTSETLFYRRDEQHAEKLRAIASVLEETVGAGEHLLDAGCGYGALLEHFEPPGGYEGLDLVPSFLQEARRRYPGRHFRQGDLAGEAMAVDEFSPEWVVLAGVLNSVPDPWLILSRALGLATRGVVFDVVLRERVADFKDLNQFCLEDVVAAVGASGLHATVSDAGNLWVVIRAERWVE
jgi:SAM-dependent methyltransferase